jgi:hypothetical protein
MRKQSSVVGVFAFVGSAILGNAWLYGYLRGQGWSEVTSTIAVVFSVIGGILIRSVLMRLWRQNEPAS